MAARITAYVVAFIVGVTVIAGLIVGAQREDDGAVDLIVINGHVYQANGTDDLAEAVAVRGNKIVRVGSNREIQRLRRAQTTVIDAQGGAVLPGFNDAHAHLLSGGLSLDQVDLSEATSLEAVKETVGPGPSRIPIAIGSSAAAGTTRRLPAGLPTRQLLDTLVPESSGLSRRLRRPHRLGQLEGARRRAASPRRTPNPKNGTIVRDTAHRAADRHAEGSGDGLVSTRRAAADGRGQAGGDSRGARGSASPRRHQRAERGRIARRSRRSTTSCESRTISPFASIRRSRPMRASPKPISIGSSRFASSIADDPLLKSGGIKLILDGVIESHTAAMLEPYANRPAVKGDPRFTVEQLNQIVSLLDRRGWQVMTHAIGDRAVRMTLDAYERAATANAAAGARPPAPRRAHRDDRSRRHSALRHARRDRVDSAVSRPAEREPARRVGDEHRSGARRARLAVGQHRQGRRPPRLRQRLARLSRSIRMMGLHVAVNRTTLDGIPEGGWNPDERLPLRRAIDAYTRSAAWASFDEQRKGTLARDMLADLVVLSDEHLRPARRAASPTPRSR